MKRNMVTETTDNVYGKSKKDADRILYNLFGSQRIGQKGLRKIRVRINFGTKKKPKVEELDVWEQNPRLMSDHSERARNGERIAHAYIENVHVCEVSDTTGIALHPKG